jgi:NTE family protein
MHNILMELYDSDKLDEVTKEKFKKVEPAYHKLAVDRGAIIKDITRIERRERIHFLFEDADFSLATIKQLISDGEKDAEKVLSDKL